MDGFSLAGGVGSLVVAGFCYTAYRNRQNVASFLKNTESLDVSKNLYEKIKDAPDHTLNYVAIRGDAKALESTIKSSNVPAAKVLIQKITLLEHKAEWVRSSKLWRDTTRTISTVVNHVPFSLASSNSRVKVTVEEPLSASGLEYNRIYNKYDPLNSLSMSENIAQWASGEKTKGIQTIEDVLLQGSTLTAIGKVTLQNGILKIKPPDTYEYFLSKLPLDGIIREKTSSSRKWKYVSIFFGVTGGLLLLIWLYRKWQRRLTAPTVGGGDRYIHPPPPDVLGLEPDAGDDQLCVICLTQRRNVVILNCGHICACRECAMQVDICPVCRGEIVRLVPTYRS